MVDTRQSEAAHDNARRYLPGGVTGAGRQGDPYPIRFASGHGKHLVDVDGNKYLDLHGGFGTAILGYSHEEVDSYVAEATRRRGTFVGLPNPYEVDLAERLCDAIPGADMVALCGGGGSDAVYHAVRIARAVTSRPVIVKMEGGYHGWHSDVGVSVAPGAEDFGDKDAPRSVPNSPGILPCVAEAVVVVTVNDVKGLERVFSERGGDVAAVIIEPVVYSSGCVVVTQDYMEAARRLCTAAGSALIFDEVMTGFRNGLAGAGSKFGVTPDLAAFGKAVANGYIISVLAGQAALMSQLAPNGPVFYSGTFNGHPLSVAAAEKTLDVLERDHVPASLGRLTTRLMDGINGEAQALGVNAVCRGVGSVWALYLGISEVIDYRDVIRTWDSVGPDLNAEYRSWLLSDGIYIHKRHVNRAFLSAQHTEEDVDRVISSTGAFLKVHRDLVNA